LRWFTRPYDWEDEMLYRGRKPGAIKPVKGNVFTLPNDSRQWRKTLGCQKNAFYRKYRRQPTALYVSDKSFAERLKHYTSVCIKVDDGSLRVRRGQAKFVIFI